MKKLIRGGWTKPKGPGPPPKKAQSLDTRKAQDKQTLNLIGNLPPPTPQITTGRPPSAATVAQHKDNPHSTIDPR
ncbi:hypothetical protein RHMOL_Rhmol13G0297900 [Rhododendron molle]|uniref:Uncharacterized protein n=1 Tax=Rhododendron molle TaxID=49168 RepID=A0ACC0LD79_RHOML|nr:hypothetical protein RHMOL_Rhmol13G0297900 [Rhododendron molle]